jgi:hypothetical protein
MEKERQNYLSPECETFEIKLEGVIAISSGPEDYIDPFGGEELTW